MRVLQVHDPDGPDVFDPDGANQDVSDIDHFNPNILNPDRLSSRRRLLARFSALGPSSSNSRKYLHRVDRLMDRYCGPPENLVETEVNSRKGMMDSWKCATEALKRSVKAKSANSGQRELKDS